MSTIAIDFDGVIHAYSKGWHDGTIYDQPIPGALETIRNLMTQHAVAIFTSRNTTHVAAWMTERGFRCHVGHEGKFWNTRGSILVTNRKIPAAVYLDDRGVQFTGDWKTAVTDMQKFLQKETA